MKPHLAPTNCNRVPPTYDSYGCLMHNSPSLDMALRAFFSLRLCLALLTSSSGKPAACATYKHNYCLISLVTTGV